MSVWKVFSDDKVIRRLGTSSNREQRVKIILTQWSAVV